MSFKAAQAKIAAKEGVSSARAGAILAAGARKASPKAIKANPKLLKVSGVSQMHPRLAADLHRHATIVGKKKAKRA